jgi:hypothetical protein
LSMTRDLYELRAALLAAPLPQRQNTDRAAVGSRRPGCGRWIGNPRLECSRRFTSLWIGTTAKVRLAVVPLSSGACEWHAAVNIRSEFEIRKPRRR